MPRTTRVAKAQQRYETVPVLGEDGQPVKIALTNKDGSPKMTRAKAGRPGRPIFLTKTVADKSKPKPLLRCDYPGCQIDGGLIAIGTPYKWIKPKSGPYGGIQKNRHDQHPGWNVWEYSNSLDANIARIENDWELAKTGAGSSEDLEAARDEFAEAVNELAGEKSDAASNMEEGFGHETEASMAIAEVAEALETWASEIESMEIPEKEDCQKCEGTGRHDCDTCGGDGELELEAGEGLVECDDCSGEGEVDCEEECDDGVETDEQYMERVNDEDLLDVPEYSG